MSLSKEFRASDSDPSRSELPLGELVQDSIGLQENAREDWEIPTSDDEDDTPTIKYVGFNGIPLVRF